MSPYCHPPHLTGEPLSQSNPLHSLGLFYPDDRPTESIEGFIRDGVKQRAYILESLRLTGRTFQWFAGISHEEVLSLDRINEDWKSFTNRTRRYYDQGLAFCWVREPTPSDPRKLHYHLAVLDNFCGDKETMRGILKKCLSRFSRNHLWIKPARPPFEVVSYMFKIEDRHCDKILLFKPGLNLRRHGLAGHFLPEGLKKKSLVKRINTREREISAGASMLGHPELIRHISTFLQLPVKKIRRLVGEDPYSPAWESWIDSMERSGRS